MFKPESLLNHPIGILSDSEQVEARKSPEDMVAFRKEQSTGSRLAERITGLRPDDPKMIERLAEDQKIFRSRYGLPLDPKPENPNEYEIFLRKYLKKIGVTVRPTCEFGGFFSSGHFAGGVHFSGDKKIGLDINKEDRKSHTKSATALEHELIHALQTEYFPGLPVELMEYEAYISGMNIDGVKAAENPAEVIEAIFQYLIAASVLNNYNYRSKEEGRKIRPEWDDPTFFLKNVDHVDEQGLKDM